MNLPNISIQRPLMMVMIILAVVLFGLVSFLRLPVDMMPEMDLPYVTVMCLYPGAGPEEMETSVIKPIEEEMTTISGLKNMTCYCMETMSYVILEFNSDINADLAAIDVKDKIDAILFTLPEDLQKPVIGKWDPNSEPIITLALTGNTTPEKLREIVDTKVKDRFVKIVGVAKVGITGGREREIVVNLKRQAMDAHGLSIAQVFPLITAQSANFPAGYVTGVNREYTVRVQGEFISVDEIANLRIPVMKMGKDPILYTVRLRDIAEIKDAYKEVRERARFNQRETVQLAITRRPDANTVQVADRILKEIDRLNKELPQGYVINIAEDRSGFIRNTVKDTYGNILMGITLTALILLLFLFDWKLMIIAGITMPVSLIMALAGMKAMGFSLNMVTLMALSISVGILVTNAIIVIENIVRHRNSGMPVHEAARVGSTEIMMAVLASTLTNLAVFIPIATTSGITGNVFKELGLTIVFATVASLFLSFTLTPLMASRMLKARKVEKGGQNLIDRFMNDLDVVYEKILHRLLHKKMAIAVMLIGTILLLVGTLKFIAPQIGSEFMPQTDQGYIDIDVELPPGTPLSVTDKTVNTIEARVRKIQEVNTIASSLGGSDLNAGVNIGKLTLQMVDAEEREKSTADIVQEIRPLLADLPDAVIVVKEASNMGGPSEADVVVEVTGDDMDEILALADSVMRIVEEVPGLTDFNTSWKGAKPEIKIIPDRDRLEHYGLSPNVAAATTVQMLGGIMRFTMSGYDEGVFREKGEEYPIRVQLTPEDRNTAEKIENLQIMTQKGPVPVKAIADVVYEGGASSITRKNRQRMVKVLANITEGTSGGKVQEISKRIKELDVKPGYKVGFGGDQEMMEESFGELAIAGGLAVALTYMLLVALLESLSMAFVIWLTLPLGLVGVVWALFLTGNSFSMISLLSVIMLVGIVVNNAILLIDYARQQRKQFGISAIDAIVKAAGTKLKAIIMSNLAIIISLLPMALALGAGGKFRAPFAITAIGGILVSTLLTFFIIPALYVLTAPKKVEQPQ